MGKVKGKRTKKCRRCGVVKPIDEFVDTSGAPNPRGGYCHECHLERVNEWEIEAKAEKESKIRKLEIIYGKWWPYHCPPLEFADDLYKERDFCPYCGCNLPPQYLGTHPDLGTTLGRAHLDHMDPLELGGEDSIRNAVYVCDGCNLKKGRKSFINWLDMLTSAQAKISRDIYQNKHGHPPEDFVPGDPTDRFVGLDADLLQDEEWLREMYPEPIADGPPRAQSAWITFTIGVGPDEHVEPDKDS